MSSKYIVRQPIKDQANKIIGYEIQYHGENQAFGDNGKNVRENDFAAADTIYNFLTMNTDKLLRGSLNFMTFTTTLLMKKTPHLFDKGELVIQIDDSVIIHPLAMHMVQQYAKEGYQVAVNEFQFAPRYLGILDRIDYIKLNIQTTPELTLKNIIDIAHSMKKQCIAVGIDREETYQKAVKLGVDALEGPYVAEKLTTQTHSSGYLQSNFFRLMVAMTRDEPDVEEIERIVKPCGLGHSKARDISACMKMLKEKYQGKVPEDFDALLELPGVGRKSANLVMGDVFGQPAIVTDTHCIRLVNRIGLVDGIKEPKKVEMALWKLIPPEESNDFCHRLVDHGRAVCTARTAPYCDRCCLNDICKKAGI